MTPPSAIQCAQMPIIGIPEPPALFSDTNNLLVAYETDEEGLFAIVRFVDVVDHHLSPINDEGLGKHPYAKSGLRFYSFHEILNSPESRLWAPLAMRHWVLTFKDNTLDVLAKSIEIVTTEIPSRNAATALLAQIQGPSA